MFDANVGVGHRPDRPAPFGSPQELLAEMGRHGVERAIVHHQMGETLSAITANELLPKWCGGVAALTLQWMASSEPDSLTQLQELHASGVVSNVRLHDCAAAGEPFVDWLYGDLLAWLQQEKLPLWLSIAEDWDRTWLAQIPGTPIAEVINTLRGFPDLRSVVVGGHYRHSTQMRSLLDKLPNCVIELSRYEPLGEVERLIERYGAQRFVYGSFYPRFAMGSILFYLHRIGLAADQLASVCAGRANALLTR